MCRVHIGSYRRLLNVLLTVLLFAFLASPSFATSIFVVGSDNSLYTIDPTTGALTLIGASGALGITMADIAETSSGGLYAVNLVSGSNNTSNLYSVNPLTGVATLIGGTGASLSALTIGPNATLFAGGGTKSNTPQTNFYTVNTSTGAATVVASGTAFNTPGDLEALNGTLYITGHVDATTDQLYTVNAVTGAVTALPSTIGFPNVAGLAVQNGILYGFSNGTTNNVISINLTTGVGIVVHSFTNAGGFQILGATDEPSPEPATVVLMGLGILGMAGFAYRRKRSVKA